MINKKLIFALILFIFTIAAVSANELNSTDDSISEVEKQDVVEISQETEIITQKDSLSDIQTETTQNGGFSDIQTELDNANNGDTIELNGSYSGNKEIYIDKTITLDGKGATLDAQDSSRILVVRANNVIIKNINFINANGYSSSYGRDYGGAIFFGYQVDNFLVENCNFTNCRAEFGGAIFLYEYEGVAKNCNFINCHAGYRGGALMWMDAENCNFIGNSADGDGGAMFGGFARECRFVNNSAKECGGALNRVEFYKCYFESNTPEDVSDDSWERFIVNATLKITQTGSYYGDKKLKIALKNSKTGEGISNQKIILTFSNSKKVTLWTENGGTVEYSVPFTPGTYSVKAVVDDEFINTSSQKLSNIKIAKATATISPTKLSTTYASGKYFQVKLINSKTKNGISNAKVTLKVYTGKKYQTVKLTTNAKGIAKYLINSLSVGTHKVIVSNGDKSVSASSKTSSITISQAALSVSASKVTNVYQLSTKYSVTVKNKASKKPVSGVQVTFKVYTGSKYKTITAKTDSNGIASFNTKSLSVGTHKIIIETKASSKFKSASKSSSVAITKEKLATHIEAAHGTWMKFDYADNGRLQGIYFTVNLLDSKNNVLKKTITIQAKMNDYGTIKDYGDLSTGTSGSTIYANLYIGGWSRYFLVSFAGDQFYKPSTMKIELD